jgi:hypothetical protein
MTTEVFIPPFRCNITNRILYYPSGVCLNPYADVSVVTCICHQQPATPVNQVDVVEKREDGYTYWVRGGP